MAAEPINVQLAIERVYLRDLSLESPQAPGIFREEWKPQVHLDINTRSRALEGVRYEVVLTVTLDAKIADRSALIVELQQAGIFRVEGAEGAVLEQILAVACPNVLFPYVRETVDNLVIRGTFPPFMLAPVNFEALFANAVKQRNAANDEDVN